MIRTQSDSCRRTDVGRFPLAGGVYPWGVAIAALLAGSAQANAAELSASKLFLRPGAEGRVVVSGFVENEATFGVTIMLELVPRPGSKGELTFTTVDRPHARKRGSKSIHRKAGAEQEVRVSKPHNVDTDIVELGDPWPGQGTFTAFDTDLTSSAVLNGVISDNGAFIAAPLEYSGALSAHPVRATANARGVWDVLLSTSSGDSTWEGLPTTLHAGFISVSVDACVADEDCKDHK